MLFPSFASAAPSFNILRTILPEANNTYDLGTTTNRWKTGYFDTVNASHYVGIATTTWGSIIGTLSDQTDLINFLTNTYAKLTGAIFTGPISAQNFTGTSTGINTGDQVGDGSTIIGAGTVEDPFTAISTVVPNVVSDDVYGSAWDGVAEIAPSKNTVYDKIESLAGGHDAVSLDTNADNLLTLTGQELGLAEAGVNEVLVGNGTGLPISFRALGTADIPDLSAIYATVDTILNSADFTPIAHKTTEDAINGIVKVDGAGTYSVAQAGTDFQAPLGYTAENTANKSTDIEGDSTSTTKYLSVKTTKDYIDAQVGAIASGQIPKESCRVATVEAGTLATDFENGDTIDTVTLATGDRILIKNQASAVENGIYTVNASGAPTRATDYNTDAEVSAGTFTFIVEGSQMNTQWIQITQSPTLGSSDLVFSQIGAQNAYTASLGVQTVGNDFRANLQSLGGLELNGNAIQVNTDDLSIEKHPISGDLRLKFQGVQNAALAGNISDTKLLQITTASKVHGSSITGLTSLPSGAGIIPAANLGTGGGTTDFLRKDGTYATPAGGVGVVALNYSKSLDTNVTPVTISNSLDKTTIYSYTVPANTLGTNGVLDLNLSGTYLNNSGATKTVTVTLEYGGTIMVTTVSAAITPSAVTGTFNYKFNLSAGGVTNSQIASFFGVHELGTGVRTLLYDNGTSAIDSTTNQTLLVTVKLSAANATQTFIRKSATVNKINATDTVGSPVDASYLTLSNNGSLTNERTLTAGNGLELVDGGANSAAIIDAKVQMSITKDGSGLKLSGDSATPGNSKVYSTNASGTKGWFDPTGGTGGGHTIQDDGTPMTQRANLNIVGAVISDDAGNDATVVTLPLPSGGGLTPTILASNITGSTDNLYYNDEAAADYEVTLPSSPTDGDKIGFINISQGSEITTNYEAKFPFDSNLTDIEGNVTLTNSGASVSTTTKKVGAGSLYIPLYSYADGGGTNPTSFNFGTGDWTVEAWVRQPAWQHNVGIFAMGDNGTSNSISLWVYGVGYNIFSFDMWSSDGTSFRSDRAVNPADIGLAANTWYHIAMVRSGNTLTSYVNGAVYKTEDVTGKEWNMANSRMMFGKGFYEAGYYAESYIDDFKISNVARYTAAFDPETQAGNIPPKTITVTPASGGQIYGLNVDESMVIDEQGENKSLIFLGTKWFNASF